jgi:TPR repeat protein
MSALCTLALADQQLPSNNGATSSPTQQASSVQPTLAKSPINLEDLPYAGLSTLELERLFNERGDYGAALQLGRYWFLNRTPGKTNTEADYLAKKWLTRAQGSGHPAIELYLDAIAHPEHWDEPMSDNAEELNAEDTDASKDSETRTAPLPDGVKEQLEACKELAESGDVDAINVLTTLLPAPSHEDFSRWLAPLRAEARKGDMNSAASLAELLITNTAANEKDIAEGIRWAKKAAKAGNTDAMVLLGCSLIHELTGDHSEKSLAEGKEWLEKAEQAGHIDAIRKLHLLMRSSVSATPEEEEIAKDQDKKRLRQLCDRGQIDILVGRGIELVEDNEDAPGGLSMLERAADQESFQALDALARYYEDNDYNVPQDDAKCFRYARALADKGGAKGMIRLAKYYEKGTSLSKKDPEAAMSYIQQAMAQPHRDPEAAVTYARFKMKGFGTEEDPSGSFKILKGLEQEAPDTPELDFLLGYMYEEGLGTQRDLTAALRYYKQGAEKGDNRAMNNLASMYELGSGADRDINEAIKWYGEAARLGNDDAKVNLKRAKAAASKNSILQS